MDNKIIQLMNHQFDELVKRIDGYKNEIDKFKDKVYDRMDAVYKEVVSMRLEQSMHTGSHERINDDLEDHDRRLKKLESPNVTAHQMQK